MTLHLLEVFFECGGQKHLEPLRAVGRAQQLVPGAELQQRAVASPQRPAQRKRMVRTHRLVVDDLEISTAMD
jgi:hypothetical protein